ncbi:uncharacterized protein G2W53_022129 [Senna tora]|uniref:Uncharacterized protein n=1 Tax=Senna tora TaxID=362788 RepID=A0A834WHV4_9FABA|nr:uncharacterized protein G2W53_022129 [Senna tora]
MAKLNVDGKNSNMEDDMVNIGEREMGNEVVNRRGSGISIGVELVEDMQGVKG